MPPATWFLALLALGLCNWIFTPSPQSVDATPSFVPRRYHRRRDRNAARQVHQHKFVPDSIRAPHGLHFTQAELRASSSLESPVRAP